MQLPVDEAHIWYAWPERVEDAALEQVYGSVLDAGERERCDRFRSGEARREYLTTRVLVRGALSCYVDAARSEWRFEPNVHGRPEVASPAAGCHLRFNASHTRGLAACVVAVGREVGIDAESIDRRTEVMDVADRFFSPPEAATLRALAPASMRDRFFSYWTLKEAYLKARGLGLSVPLHQVSFSLGPEGNPAGAVFDAVLSDFPERWQFALLSPSSSHRVAVALARREGETVKLIAQPGDLLAGPRP